MSFVLLISGEVEVYIDETVREIETRGVTSVVSGPYLSNACDLVMLLVHSEPHVWVSHVRGAEDKK